MEQWVSSRPDISSYTNREQRDCPICSRPFMAGAEGIKLQHMCNHLNDTRGYILGCRCIPYKMEWYCSEECVTFQILAGIKQK